MAVKNTKQKKSAKRVKDLSPKEEVAHYLAILVEDMQSSFKMVVEKVEGIEESLIRRMDEKFAEQDFRFDRIEFVLGQHSDILKEHSRILEKHSKILDAHSRTLEEHSNSLERLESKLDTVILRVDRHDELLQPRF